MPILNNIIILTGPTGVGKTAVSIKILQNMPAIEIISADSMQIYKYMNIGTAKPNKAILENYKHHCINIVEPHERFDANKFSKLANNYIQDIFSRNKKPLIVGGSGLYIKSILKPLSKMPGNDVNIRKRLIDISNMNGKEYLFNILTNIDPYYSKKINVNDTKRIIRALEIYQLTGKPISYFYKLDQNNHNQSLIIEGKQVFFYTICLYMERDKLYHRINKRVDDMFKKGLLNETEELLVMLKQKCTKINSFQSMQGLGYKQIIKYVNGKLSKAELIEQIKKETRNFAKRQMSWFKNQIKIDSWINIDDYNSIESCSEVVLSIMKEKGY